MRKPTPKKLDWWRPIETGGSVLCPECPQFLKQRDETYSYAGTVRALEEEVARYQIELDSARQELDVYKDLYASEARDFQRLRDENEGLRIAYQQAMNTLQDVMGMRSGDR